MRNLLICILISGLFSCAGLRTNRNETQAAAEADKKKNETPKIEVTNIGETPPKFTPETFRLTNKDLEKYAYEIGLDPRKELTAEQLKQIEMRKKLRVYERSLDSQKERLQYSKVLPWLKTDDEKVEFLSIPTLEGRQVWINKNKIFSRQKEMKDYIEVMESQDIAVGMPADLVKRAWGEPDQVEASGNPIYKNERWKYLKQISTPQGYKQEKRFVYFEGGRVVGWETE